MCRDALAAATRDDERKLVMDALARIPSKAALELAQAPLDKAGMKEAACSAAVLVGERIIDSQPAAVAKAMKQVVQTTASNDLAGQAKALLG